MQPDFELRFHPVDLTPHGLNPYGKPIYRVVWADTRKTTVVCRGKRYVLPRYVHGAEADCKGKWVLEKWAPPDVVLGITREQYEAMLAAFPGAAAEAYPEKGEYELSRIFNEESGPFCKRIDEIALHKQLYFHEWKHERMSDNDRALEAASEEEGKEALADDQFEAIFDEAREESHV